MRPARRSVILPFSSTVQKLPRMAMSCFVEREVNPQGFQDTASDHIFQRIVAKECQVSRAAARAESRGDHFAQTQGRTSGQRVHIGGTGSFELGRTARFQRQAAQPIHHQQDNF